jgi:hypothetical protein
VSEHTFRECVLLLSSGGRWKCGSMQRDGLHWISEGKAVPVTGNIEPQGCVTLRFPHGDEVISVTFRPAGFNPRKIPGASC